MKNYFIIYFLKGLPIYFKYFNRKTLKKYFIMSLNVYLLKLFFIKKKLYFTNYTTLLFLVHYFKLLNNQILAKKNLLLKITIDNTDFEMPVKKKINVNNLILFKKQNFLINKTPIWKDEWKFTENQILLIKESYKTNFVKIWFFESYRVIIYDINNHYAFAMSKNLPTKVRHSDKTNLKKNFGILKTLEWSNKKPIFLNTVLGLTESTGIIINFLLKKKIIGDSNFLLTLYYFNKLNFKREKKLLKLIEQSKNIEKRDLKKKMLVQLYGKFATNYLSFSKKKKCSPLPFFITTYSRNFIFKITKPLSLLYSDTDSLFLSTPLRKKYLMGYIGYIKNIFKSFIFFHFYILNEKKYCGLILANQHLFFLVTLNILHIKNNFIKSYTSIFLYKNVYTNEIDLNKIWRIKSFYKKKINIVRYNTLKLLKTITFNG